MGLRAFIASHFGKPVDDTPYSFTEADRAVDYCGIVVVGDDFYDPPDTAFSDTSIKDQPAHHPVSFRRKGQHSRV